MERKVILPNHERHSGTEELVLIDNLVIIGANGSGKSRLGSYVEQKSNDRLVKRISAQRLLNLPDAASQRTFVQSLQELLTGTKNANVSDIQNEYEIVLSTLFAQTAKRNEEYVEASKNDHSEEKLAIYPQYDT